MPCGANTASRLAALGDTQAVTDSADCAQRIANCKQNQPRKLTGASIRVQKQADGTWTLNGSVCTAPAAPPQVTAAMVRAQAVRLIPAAALGLAPHDTTLVNIQTIMWVDTPEHRTLRPVTILGQRVLIHLTIDHVHWTYGDHTHHTSPDPGTPYTQNHPCHTAQCPGYRGHTYRQPGTHTITATTTWHATFTVNDGPATPIPDTINGPTATTHITVKQAHAVLTPNPGEH